MGYTMQNGRYASTLPVVIQDAVTKTATFTGSAFEIGDRGTARLDLVITAASGTTPTLDLAIQTSADGTTWVAVAAFAQQTGVATVHKVFTGLDRFVRAVATIAGTTPSFSYSVSGECV